MKPIFFLLIASYLIIGGTCAYIKKTTYNFERPRTFVSAKTTKEKPSKKAVKNPKVLLGKKLFRNNCASCHNKNMKDKMTGPALGGVEERWSDFPKEDLYSFIRNNRALYAEGHPRAKLLIDEWKHMMNAFPNLKDDEIEAILTYVDDAYKK